MPKIHYFFLKVWLFVVIYDHGSNQEMKIKNTDDIVFK
jgi:hypothetical protein